MPPQIRGPQNHHVSRLWGEQSLNSIQGRGAECKILRRGRPSGARAGVPPPALRQARSPLWASSSRNRTPRTERNGPQRVRHLGGAGAIATQPPGTRGFKGVFGCATFWTAKTELYCGVLCCTVVCCAVRPQRCVRRGRPFGQGPQNVVLLGNRKSMERDPPKSMERDPPKSMERDQPKSMERDQRKKW